MGIKNRLEKPFNRSSKGELEKVWMGILNTKVLVRICFSSGAKTHYCFAPIEINRRSVPGLVPEKDYAKERKREKKNKGLLCQSVIGGDCSKEEAAVSLIRQWINSPFWHIVNINITDEQGGLISTIPFADLESITPVSPVCVDRQIEEVFSGGGY